MDKTTTKKVRDKMWYPLISAEARQDAKPTPVFDEFKRYLKLPSATKGKVSMEMLMGMLSDYGIKTDRMSPRTDLAAEVDGKVLNLEVKSSTLWGDEEASRIVWQQLRPSQEYDAVVLIGYFWDRAGVWVFDKDEVEEAAVGQHTGFSAKETKWINVKFEDVDTFIDVFGSGTITDAVATLREIAEVK